MPSVVCVTIDITQFYDITLKLWWLIFYVLFNCVASTDGIVY